MKIRTRWVVWTVLIGWAVVLAVASHLDRTAPARSVGKRLVSSTTVLNAVEGGRTPLLARDSLVAVLVASPVCGACRLGVPNYSSLANSLGPSRIAFRVLVSGDTLQVRQYSLLFPEHAALVVDEADAIKETLTVRTIPTLLLLDERGTLLGRWSPVPPEEVATRAVLAAAGVQARR